MKRRQRTTMMILTLGLILGIYACVAGSARLSADAAARSAQPDTPTTSFAFGIDLPLGAVLEQLPPGITDYIRKTWPGLLPERPTTNPEPGVDLPFGATPSDLPPGMRDYLHDPTPGPRRGPAQTPIPLPKPN